MVSDNLTDRSFVRISKTDGGQKVLGGSSSPRALSERIRAAYIRRVMDNARMIPEIMQTWSAADERDLKFQEHLMAEMTPEWWAGMVPCFKQKIVQEWVRIDGGRGIIVDWLTNIVRCETSLVTLQEITKWKPQGYAFPASLLEAWSAKIADDNLLVRAMALKVIISAPLPSGKVPEHLGHKSWDEKQRAETILKYLSEAQIDINTEQELKIIAQWRPLPGFCDRNLLLAIMQQWNRHMEHAVKDESYISGSANNPLAMEIPANKFCLAVWEGFIGLAQHCPDGEAQEIVLGWLKYWLSREVSLEMLKVMSRWVPPDEVRQGEVAELWSRRLMNFCGYANGNEWQIIWQIIGRYFSGDRRPGAEMQGIFDNCLNALREITEEKERQAENIKNEGNRLHINLPPLETTGAHLAEPDGLWVSLLESAPPVIAERLVEGLQPYENDQPARLEVFHRRWKQLCQCQRWKDPNIRLTAARQLTAWLERGRSSGWDISGLESLWLKMLREEREGSVIECLGEWQFKNMEKFPGLLQDSKTIWKKKSRDDSPEVRCQTWNVLSWTGMEVWPLLAERLMREKDLSVVMAMFNWNPLPGEPMPPGFWKKWSGCLCRILTEIIDYRQGVGEMDGESIVCVGRELGIKFVEAGLGEKRKSAVQESELKEMWKFWDTMVRMVKRSGWDRDDINRNITPVRKSLEVLFSLDAPRRNSSRKCRAWQDMGKASGQTT